MKIYVSTPVNGRPEASFAEKYAAAQKRVQEIIAIARTQLPNDTFISFQDVAPLGMVTEEQAMGNCIQCVLECDALLADYGTKALSKGCQLEWQAAFIYRKARMYILENGDIKRLD